MDYYKLKVLNHKKKITIVLIILIAIISIIYYFYYYNDNTNENDVAEINNNVQESLPEKINNNIYVDIKGYVLNPGVYSFKKDDDARINDLILKAGGLKKDADTSLINLSKKLQDEMTIIIYSKSEINEYLNNQNNVNNLSEKLEICELNLQNNACIEKEEEEKSISKIININLATIDELMTLSGIGKNKAKAIIEYRQNNAFKMVEDIKNVEGIGESLYEKIKDNITV